MVLSQRSLPVHFVDSNHQKATWLMAYLLMARAPGQPTVSSGVRELLFWISMVFMGPSAMLTVVDTALRF